MSLTQRLWDQQIKEKAQVSQIKLAEDDRTDRQWIQFAENVKCPLPWLYNWFSVHVRFKVIKNDTQVFVWHDHFHTVVVNGALLCYISVSLEINHWLFGFRYIQVEEIKPGNKISGRISATELGEETATQCLTSASASISIDLKKNQR